MVAMLLVLSSLSQATRDGMTLEKVLERHQQYLDRIHTLDATIEVWDSKDGGTTWSVTMRYRWVKDGPRERTTSWSSGYTDPGGTFRQEEVRLDTSFAPGETRHLQGWDAEHPPTEQPSPANRYHKAMAQIGGGARNRTLSSTPPVLMMLAPTYEDYLPGAVHGGSNSSLERATHDGRACWDIRFSTQVGVPAVYRVTLDPTRGFAMIRQEARSQTKDPAGGVAEVVEFREAEEGLFIPVRIRATSPDQPSRIVERRVTSLEVNEPVPAEALTVRFPEGMRVLDSRSSPNNVVTIWGTDGPALTFDTPAAYEEYTKSFFKRKPPTPNGWLLGATAISIAAAVVLLLVRRRLGNAA